MSIRLAVVVIGVASLAWSEFGMGCLAQETEPSVEKLEQGDNVSTDANAATRAAQAADDAGEASEATPEPRSEWEFFVPLQPSSTSDTNAEPVSETIADVVLMPSVFSHAREDLADLRLFDSANRPIPYALRYLRPTSVRAPVRAEEFNRTDQDDGPSEITLELQGDDVQHNEVDIVTSGTSFRRLAKIDGSDDGRTWRELATGHLLRYQFGGESIDHHQLSYSPSRFRFVRIRVWPDPEYAETNVTSDEFKITRAEVLRSVEVPGERLMLQASIGDREPARVHGIPGSAWMIDLGGKRVPCDRIEVWIADREFARDFEIEYESLDETTGQSVFYPVTITAPEQPLWQRRAGDEVEPMVAEFNEVQTSRLRLRVFDHRNAPLRLESARFGAAVRQVIFAIPSADQQPLRLYFGNPEALSPNYDFARNLPDELNPSPTRWKLGEVEKNPEFVPSPQQVTERLPWLIYAVLATVAVALGLVILNISRQAIQIHDAQSPARESA